MIPNRNSHVRRGGRRTVRKAMAAVPTLFKVDHARRIDRVIDYFGGAGAGLSERAGDHRLLRLTGRPIATTA